LYWSLLSRYTSSVIKAYFRPLRGVLGAGEGGRSWPSRSSAVGALPLEPSPTMVLTDGRLTVLERRVAGLGCSLRGAKRVWRVQVAAAGSQWRGNVPNSWGRLFEKGWEYRKRSTQCHRLQGTYVVGSHRCYCDIKQPSGSSAVFVASAHRRSALSAQMKI
jgi:hypothetical protein